MKPKLTLRDLFWLVLVVAMGLGWWLERQKHLRRAGEHDWIVEQLDKMGAEVGNDNSGKRAIVWPGNTVLRQMTRKRQ